MQGDDIQVVTGGATRQTSVLNGLEALADEHIDTVLIHDAVRPFVDPVFLQRIITACDGARGAIPALPVSDTLKRGANGIVEATVDRNGLYMAQTPQAFPFEAILSAHRKAAASGKTGFTDDASIAEWAGMTVSLVEGSAANVKLTYARDLAMADEKLGMTATTFPDIRTGNGYDVHAFAAGDHVTLCGIDIPHDARLSGHSDADVCLHALTDALLATIGDGDIGGHFPPSDPQWKGMASNVFIQHAAKLVRDKGGRIANADITIIAEEPKIGPHRVAMVTALSDMLAVEHGRVSVKATTNEKLGFIGRAEGIAAIATATVVFAGEVPR